ncbi:MAG: cupin domain-containing protein [Halobacteriales archaeon]|nr:cupin domain-containing protein [Halobacteriales archaeon]
MKETRRATVEGEDGDVKHLFDVPRCLRLRLAEGEERPEHSHPGNEILLFVHEGVLEMRLDGEPHLVEEGEAIRFSGEREISPHAVEDTVAVLVFVETDAP